MNYSPKQLILGAATLLVFFLGWYFLNITLESKPSYLELGIVTAVILIIFGIFFSFSAFFIENRALLILLAAILAILPLLIFGKNNYFLIGFLIFFLSSIGSTQSFKKGKKETLKFDFLRVSSHELPMIFTALAIILAIIFTFSLQLPEKGLEMPKPLFDKIYDTLTAVLAKQIPDYKQITAIEGSEEMIKEMMYYTINERIAMLLKPYQEYLPLLFVFIVFTIIKPLTIPLVWLSSFFGWLFFKLLLAVKVFSVKKEMVEKETILL